MRMMPWISLTIAAFALVACAGSAGNTTAMTAAEAEAPLVFTSVNVLPMTAGEPVLRNQSVVVERVAANSS